MSSDAVIVTLGLKQVSRTKVEPDKFQLRRDRPHFWLQRACVAILRRLGCNAHTECIDIERHVIGRDGEYAMSRIMKHVRNASSFSCSRPMRRILIGAEDYAEIMGEVVSSQYFSFDGKYMLGRGPWVPAAICGCEVEVIPWMRGVIALPAPRKRA